LSVRTRQKRQFVGRAATQTFSGAARRCARSWRMPARSVQAPGAARKARVAERRRRQDKRARRAAKTVRSPGAGSVQPGSAGAGDSHACRIENKSGQAGCRKRASVKGEGGSTRRRGVAQARTRAKVQKSTRVRSLHSVCKTRNQRWRMLCEDGVRRKMRQRVRKRQVSRSVSPPVEGARRRGAAR